MKIIAQKSNNLNTYDFFYHSLVHDYINAISFNITYTKDNKIVIFNTSTNGAAITNTINSSTLGNLQEYEIILLDNALKKLSQSNFKKEIYINLVPSNYDVITDENIYEITKSMNNYINELKSIIDNYPNLIINLHSINRSLVTILNKIITNRKIGFVVSEDDFNFIDVEYYIILANIVNDSIIDLLIKKKKEVNIYIYSDYYISYIYEHYLGEKSTPIMQDTFNKLGIISSYPEIINKVFRY